MFFGRFFNKAKRRQVFDNYFRYKENVDKIEGFFSNTIFPDKERKCIQKYVKRNGINGVFPYNFPYHYYWKAALSIKYDKNNEMFYAFRKGRKLYLKQKSYEKALTYYSELIYEQDRKSPHLYSESKISGDVLFDCGAAEGFLALDNVNNFSKIYLFEIDSDWIKALECTFSRYMDKVEIINKYVGNANDERNVSLDEILKGANIGKGERIFVKIDVEGSEDVVLKGADFMLMQYDNLKLAVCTYHNQNDEVYLRGIVEDYDRFNISYSSGYMIMYYDKNIQSPFLRRGIMRVESKK